MYVATSYKFPQKTTNLLDFNNSTELIINLVEMYFRLLEFLLHEPDTFLLSYYP